METIIGVIADTHGLLRPEAVRALNGSATIIHAGDVGRVEVLEELRKLAPVVAIRGNVDHGAWAHPLSPTETIEMAGARFHVIHNLKDLAVNPVAEGIGAVISGHSHQPVIANKNGVLYVNPGSAGPRRFKLPVTVALMRVTAGAITAELIEL